MEKSLFFNSINKDRRYYAADFAAYFASFIGNGVFAKHEQSLAVTAGDGMQVVLGTGRAFINGWAYFNTTALEMTLDTADGVLNRIDRLVLRWDLQRREIKAAILKGGFASAPIPAEVTRNSEIYELAIADILVGKGVLEITQAAVTDLRHDKELCGFVAHVVQDFDIDGLYAQQQALFDTFFAGLQQTLTGDVAGNLQQQITANKSRIYTFTLDTDWEGDSEPYTKTIALQGIKESDRAVMDVVLSETLHDAEEEADQYASVIKAKTQENSIKIWSKDKTTRPLEIQLAVIYNG